MNVNVQSLASAGAGFAAGLAIANIPLLVQKFVELPWISAWIRRNPKVAEAIVEELKKDVDAVAEAPVVQAPGAQAPKAS